jgi:adenylate cyclase
MMRKRIHAPIVGLFDVFSRFTDVTSLDSEKFRDKAAKSAYSRDRLTVRFLLLLDNFFLTAVKCGQLRGTEI